MQNRRSFLNVFHDSQFTHAGRWLHISRPAMACRFEVIVPIADREGVESARKALDEIDRLEQQLTVFRDSSEVSYINRNAASKAVTVEASLFSLLLLCRELYRDTAGAFDITSGPLTRCWGFLKREARLPEAEALEVAKTLVGSDKLLVDSTSRSIRFERTGMEINLGSIGKGYALDCAAALMVRKNRAQTALLNAGFSSMRAIGNGHSGDRGWQVGLRDPRRKDRRFGRVKLRDCAMSTSGSEEQFFEHNGRRYGHIIDPRSGLPGESVTTVSVIASSAAVADALATAFYVGGRELAEWYCAAHPDVLAIMLESKSEHPIVIGSNNRCEISLGSQASRVSRMPCQV